MDEKYGEDVASKPVEGANQGKGNFTNRHTALRLIGGGIRRASFCARTSTSSTPGPTARETCGRGISGPSTTLTCPREPITLSPGKTRGKRLPRSVRVAKGIDLLGCAAAEHLSMECRPASAILAYSPRPSMAT